MFVLFAYYILKPVSRALFLSKFEIEQLPYLYVLIAIVGGLLAYAYTHLAVKTSLQTAVNWTTVITLICLVSIWWLLKFNLDWMLYVFNIWVSLFSIVLVSQGWLAAANVFDSREAKRLYGLLGLGATAGAAFGGELTAQLAKFVEPRDLLLACAVMVIFSYLALLGVARQPGVDLANAKAAESEEDFSFGDILDGIRKHRHLQVIMGIITLTFIVDVMVEYQFSAMAKASFTSKGDLTAFLGSFYGLYLNLVTFAMQFFLTAIVVRRLGVGGTLQVMPVVIGLTSMIVMAAPRLSVASMVRLGEAASRYSFNRTGMELLYLPLPVDLKNRTKAFVDIFMDRFGRGFGAVVLMSFTALFGHRGKGPTVQQVAGLILAFCLIWVVLSSLASREYVATIRKRLASRRLNLEDARISVTDAATIGLLEKQLAEGSPRQAVYAMTLLGQAPGYDLASAALRALESKDVDLRAKALEVSAAARIPDLIDHARALLSDAGRPLSEQKAALAYLVAMSPDQPVNDSWVNGAANSDDPAQRLLAAYAIEVRGSDAAGRLKVLLADSDATVVEAACRAAGALSDRAHVDTLVRFLAYHRLRAEAALALARYGSRICGTLSDVLMDEKSPVLIRRQVPRVLRLIHEQRSADVLTAALNDTNPDVDLAVLKALNRLRESTPTLNFEAAAISKRTLAEARKHYDLHSLAAPLRASVRPATATGLLVKTLDVRIDSVRERLFRLLALRYPAKEMYDAYLAIQSGRSDKLTAALDYVESTVDRELKAAMLHMFESEDRMAEHGRHLFHIPARDTAGAVKELAGSSDSWIAACAAAAAIEIGGAGRQAWQS